MRREGDALVFDVPAGLTIIPTRILYDGEEALLYAKVSGETEVYLNG